MARPDVLGKYKIREELAGTPYGKRFRASLKGKPDHYSLDLIPNLERAARNVKQEADVAGAHDDPNIYPLYDHGMEHGRGVFVYAADDIEQLTAITEVAGKAGATLPPNLVTIIVADVCRALTYIHGRKASNGKALVHGALHPGMVMVGRDGRTRLLDNGLGRVRLGKKISTGYLAPEQLGIARPDHQADIFAVGVLLWELLTGKRLYDAKDLPALRTALREPVPAPSSINPAVPTELDEIVEIALHEDRTQRFDSTAAMTGALESYCRVDEHEGFRMAIGVLVLGIHEPDFSQVLSLLEHPEELVGLDLPIGGAMGQATPKLSPRQRATPRETGRGNVVRVFKSTVDSKPAEQEEEQAPQEVPQIVATDLKAVPAAGAPAPAQKPTPLVPAPSPVSAPAPKALVPAPGPEASEPASAAESPTSVPESPPTAVDDAAPTADGGAPVASDEPPATSDPPPGSDSESAPKQAAAEAPDEAGDDLIDNLAAFDDDDPEAEGDTDFADFFSEPPAGAGASPAAADGPTKVDQVPIDPDDEPETASEEADVEPATAGSDAVDPPDDEGDLVSPGDAALEDENEEEAILDLAGASIDASLAPESADGDVPAPVASHDPLSETPLEDDLFAEFEGADTEAGAGFGDGAPGYNEFESADTTASESAGEPPADSLADIEPRRKPRVASEGSKKLVIALAVFIIVSVLVAGGVIGVVVLAGGSDTPPPAADAGSQPKTVTKPDVPKKPEVAPEADTAEPDEVKDAATAEKPDDDVKAEPTDEGSETPPAATAKKTKKPKANKRSKPRAPKTPAWVRKGKSMIIVSVTPPSTILLDGANKGKSPKRLIVSPGPHNLTISNAKLRRAVQRKVNAKKGKEHKVFHKF